jgi:hypothetical protein
MNFRIKTLDFETAKTSILRAWSIFSKGAHLTKFLAKYQLQPAGLLIWADAFRTIPAWLYQPAMLKKVKKMLVSTKI